MPPLTFTVSIDRPLTQEQMVSLAGVSAAMAQVAPLFALSDGEREK